jgi:hypothetical protein
MASNIRKFPPVMYPKALRQISRQHTCQDNRRRSPLSISQLTGKAQRQTAQNVKQTDVVKKRRMKLNADAAATPVSQLAVREAGFLRC